LPAGPKARFVFPISTMKAPLSFRPLVFLLALIGALPVFAAAPAISLQTISSGQLVSPVYLTNAGDGSNRLFVCDQVGQVRIIQDGMLLPTPFLDLSAKLVRKFPATTRPAC